MQLELNKTYRCRNGAKVKIIRGERTMSGNYDRFHGETDDPPGNKMLIVYLPDGRPVVGKYAGYTTVEYLGGDPPELYFRLKTQGGNEVTVSESSLRHYAGQLYYEVAPMCGEEADQKRVLAAAALRMIELAKIKPPPAKPLRTRADIEDAMLLAGLDPAKYLKPPSGAIAVCPSEPTTKQIADQAARELAMTLKNDLGVDVTPILLRLWLIERWDYVAKLAHKIHNAV